MCVAWIYNLKNWVVSFLLICIGFLHILYIKFIHITKICDASGYSAYFFKYKKY